MKKIYILKESQVKNLLEAPQFANQDIIDNILDKISQSGEDSLTELEKYILRNPDAEITQETDAGESCIVDVIKLLFLNNLIDQNLMRVFEDYVEITGFLDNASLKFFDGKNFILLYCIWDDGRKVYMDFEGSQKNRDEVKLHIKNVWEELLPDTEFLTDDGMSEVD